MSSPGPIVDIAVVTGDSHKQGRSEGEEGRVDGGEGGSKPCSWTSRPPFAQSGQSPQKHQARGPWWDDKASINRPGAGNDGEASCHSELCYSVIETLPLISITLPQDRDFQFITQSSLAPRRGASPWMVPCQGHRAQRGVEWAVESGYGVPEPTSPHRAPWYSQAWPWLCWVGS